jgi:pimeloyl-ACP methyl ester carboxylesterase
MLRLPPGFRAIAPDLRGYGLADPAALVDATRGMGDFSDDLAALMDALGVERADLVGHSLGGAVLWRFLADHPGRVRSLAQVAPASPHGFGASLPDGRPATADGAGSGGAAVNPEFARLLAEGARGADSPLHPLSVLNGFVWKPPFVPARIEAILTAALAQQCGPRAYPGDARPSPNWPGMAAGRWGPINALAPLYQTDPLGFTRVAPKPPILWLRGTEDPVVSDGSLFDLGHLGALGAVPGWPGAAVFPAQPMIAQTEAALAAYEAGGGRVRRVVLDGVGHSPFLEAPAAFDAALHAHLAG